MSAAAGRLTQSGLQNIDLALSKLIPDSVKRPAVSGTINFVGAFAYAFYFVPALGMMLQTCERFSNGLCYASIKNITNTCPIEAHFEFCGSSFGFSILNGTDSLMR